MNHLKQIAAGLDEYGLDAMLVTSAPGEFYAVGFHGEGAVVVTSGECRYFTDSRYIEAAEKQVAGAHITMTDRSKNIQALVKGAVEELGVKKLGFEDGYMTVAQYNRYAGDLPCALTPANQLISKLRAAKDAEEIELMKKAQEITDKAFSEIIRFIRPGMTEREIAARLQYDMLRLGADKMSFDPIVVTGPNGSLPHGIPGDRKVEPGSFITMDFGCKYGGYCSDMTVPWRWGSPRRRCARSMTRCYGPSGRALPPPAPACRASRSTPPPARSSRRRGTGRISVMATATAWALRSMSRPMPIPPTRPPCRSGPPCPPNRVSICPAASAYASRMWWS